MKHIMKHMIRAAMLFGVITPVVAWGQGAPRYTAPVGPPSATSSITLSNISPSLSNLLGVFLGRVVSIDDAVSIHHDGVTDDVAPIQATLNAVGALGGGTVLVGPHQYAIDVAPSTGFQPTSAQFNSSGFTLFVPNVAQYFTAGNAYTLAGFTAPLTQLNGTWTASYTNAGTGVVVFLTSLTGTQANTSTGLGSIYQDMTIPSNVRLVCPKGLSGAPPAGTSLSQLPFTFLTGSVATIVPQQNSAIFGCNIINSAGSTLVQSTATIRQTISTAQAFAGVGISVNASDVQLENLLVVGYSNDIQSVFGARGRFTHLNLDGTQCITTDNSHDISHYTDIHCFPFATAATGQFASYAVTGVANNGSGLWRVSTTGSSTILVGDTVYVNGVVGAGSVNNTWSVAAVGSGYIDLTGSNAVGTSSYTGTTTFQSYCIKALTGTAGIGIGDAITGTNIPASTTVTDVLPYEATLCMSNQATAGGTGIALTTTPQAYSSSGTVWLDGTKRTGAGLSWTNGETNSCADCYVYGHTLGIYLGVASSWTSLPNVKVDNYLPEGDRNSVCLQIDGSAIGTFINGGSTNSCWVSILGTSTNPNQAHLISNMVLNSAHRVLELQSGRYEIGMNSSNASTGFVGDGVGALGYVLNDFQITWQFQSYTGAKLINPTGNTFASSQYQGNFNLGGDVSLGLGNGCTQFSNCGVSTIGPLSDGAPGSGLFGAYTIPANYGSWLFSGTAPSSYTVTMPTTTAVNGKKLNIVFGSAVTTLTWAVNGGGTVYVPYTSASQGQLVQCQVLGGAWNCR